MAIVLSFIQHNYNIVCCKNTAKDRGFKFPKVVSCLDIILLIKTSNCQEDLTVAAIQVSLLVTMYDDVTRRYITSRAGARSLLNS